MIYFAHASAPVNLVKIGHSTLPKIRVESLRAWCPVELDVICTTSGSRSAEGYIHFLMREHAFRGEWFHAHQDVFDLAETICRTGDIPGLHPLLRHYVWKPHKPDIDTWLKKAAATRADLLTAMGRKPESWGNWAGGIPSPIAQPVLDFFRSRGVNVTPQDLFPVSP